MKDWEKLEVYIAERLKEVDPRCKRQKGSGNGMCKGDIKTNLPLHIECKQRSTKDIKISIETFEKLKSEIPLHCNKLPVLALENKDGKRYAVLELDDFLEIIIDVCRKR